MFYRIERCRLDGDGLLGQPIKQLSPVYGTAAIEPKGKIVECRKAPMSERGSLLQEGALAHLPHPGDDDHRKGFEGGLNGFRRRACRPEP